mmetsp:Transcript_30478/g.98241  ORF Transcript_30478/g.98241 Transcript_30478/m.98241 type:complete len:701 (+) Transcript_30478:82-2184(+)
MEVVIVCFITFILTLSICFEFGREYLKESTAEVFQPILTSLYSELTLLGFIGLLLFAIFKLDCLEELSVRLFGEPDAIQDLGEQVHMVLFLVMVVFLLQAVAMGRFGEAIQRKWHLWEAKPLLNDKDERDGFKTFRRTWEDAVRPRKNFLGTFFARETERHRMLVHTAARLKFVEESNLKASDFDFARYLSIALGVTLGELVEVPVKTWFVLEFVLLFFWRCELMFGPNMRVFLWIWTGYVTAAGAYVVHAKIKLILHNYSAPLVRYNKHWEERAALVSSASSSSNSAAAAGERSTLLPAAAADSGNKNFKELFWFGGTLHAHFTFDCIRLASLLTSVYAAIFVLVYFDDLVVTTYSPEDLSPSAKAWRSRGRRPGGILVFAIAAIPPALVVDKMRGLLEDFTVAANIADFKNRRYVEQVLRRQKSVAAFEALKVVQCFRHPATLRKVMEEDPSSDDDDGGHKNKGAENSDDEQRPSSGNAVESSSSSPRSSSLLALTAANVGKAAVASSSGSQSGVKSRRASLMSSRRASTQALKELQMEEELAFIQRQQVHWRRIFDLFDDDKSGSITVDELRALLVKFKCDDASIDFIVATLDANSDGDVAFDEFFDFATKLTKYLETHCDPKFLTKEMFTLIDDDDSGTITVHEMHNVVADMLGQDLSVEDVFNVIQDIDVDGNGELDINEFAILLDRLGIYWNES